MKTDSKLALLLVASATIAACGDDDPPAPIQTDTGTDVGTDVEPDVDPDTDPDTDAVDPDTDAADPCDGLDLCPDEGSSCNGDDIILCTENADGCLVETVISCEDGQMCDDSGAEASCADDVCEGLDLCDEAGSFCEEGAAIDCIENEDGCVVRTVTECEDGTTCSDEGELAECLPNCEDAEGCEAAGDAACDGEILEVCEVGESGCLEVVENDCAALVEGGSCDAEGLICTTPGDPCDGIDPANLCDEGDVGAGSCDENIYSLCTTNIFGCAVIEATDCGALDGGFCTVDGCDTVEPDACSEIDPADLCEEEGVLTCSEDNVLECQRNDDGCLVIVDLGACEGDDTCVDGACIGPCDDVEVCEVALACDDDDLVGCEEVDGCLVETERVACEFGCNDTGDAPECIERDPCVDLACDPLFEVPFCDGDLLMICEDDEELGCAHLFPSDCRAEDPSNTCVDDGFAVACDVDPCGDGLFDGFVGEECDDGNNDDGDGCSAICTLEDGFECTVEGGMTVCVALECGDGVIGTGETCDDGNTDDEDGCAADCTVEEGYECIGEPSECVVPACGDGVLTSGETCDDGNTDDGDGCSAVCALELDPAGGAIATVTGTIDGSEAQYDRLSSSCGGGGTPDHYFDAFTLVNTTESAIEIEILAAWSGDGFIHVFRADFDPAAPFSTCITGDDDFDGVSGSLIESVVVEAETTVILVASTFSPAAAIGDYTLTITTLGCGDGIVGPLDDCDDGNTDDGDGCAATCTVETGYECEGEPSDCWLPDVCGGGRVDGLEECDDGNTDADDGCSPMCSVEEGYICAGERSVCTPLVCGDDIIAHGEACDDGGTVDGDGCSATCAVELSDGTSTTIENSLDSSDPVFERAAADCLSLASEVHHDVLPLVNVTESDLTVTATAAWSDDGFLHAYFGFDPFDAALNCEAGDDDFGGLDASQVIFTLPAASSAELVASSFSSLTATGAYTITVEAAAVAVEP